MRSSAAPRVLRLVSAFLFPCWPACPQEHNPPLQARPGCPSFSDLSTGLPKSPGWRTNPSLADVNGDGYLDLAATTRKGEGPKVFLFDPSGRWIDSSAGISLDLYPCGIGVDLADVSGDGNPDLIVADHYSGLYLFLGDGQGGWERFAHLRHSLGEGFNGAAAGDLDADGRTEHVALAAFSTGLTIYKGRKGGGFLAQETGLPRSGFGYEVHLADLDADGRPDLSGTPQGLSRGALAGGASESKAWLQRPGRGWEPATGLPEAGSFYGIGLGDINEDGLPDLVLSSLGHAGGVRVYLGAGGGAWKALPGAGPGEAPGRLFTGLALVDLDADGHLDLVAVEHLKPAVVIWTGDGSDQFRECPKGPGDLPGSYSPGWGLAVGDINRHGRPDIAADFGSEGGGALRAWTQTATAAAR